MNYRSVVGAMVMAGVLLSAPAVYAAPAAPFTPGHAAAASGKLINFSLRNDTGSTLKVKAGDQEMSLEPGKPVKVKLPEGLQIVVTEATPGHEAGSVVATVSSVYNGNTLAIK